MTVGRPPTAGRAADSGRQPLRRWPPTVGRAADCGRRPLLPRGRRPRRPSAARPAARQLSSHYKDGKEPTGLQKMLFLRPDPDGGALRASMGSLERGDVPSFQRAPWRTRCFAIGARLVESCFSGARRHPCRSCIGSIAGRLGIHIYL